MSLFNVKWSVTEVVNGPGKHDDGIVDGQRIIVAQGQVKKVADSEDSIRQSLISVLKTSFPEQGLGPDYNIDRVYDVNIQEAQ